MTDTPSIPAAWYDAPGDPTRLRYWDGTAWTENYAPKPGAAAAAPPASPATTPAYGAAPGYAAPAPLPVTPVVPGPLMIAGILLIVSGLARMVSNLAPLDVTGFIVAAAVESLGLIGTFVAFLMAGYPTTRTVARALSFTQIAAYAVALLLVIGATATFNGALYGIAGLLGFVVLGVGVAFGVVALRTAGLDRRVAVLPLVLYLGLLLFGVLNAASGGVSLILFVISGLVPIAVGALFLVFGRRPQTGAPASVPGVAG